jgi:uncharacterized protein YceK
MIRNLCVAVAAATVLAGCGAATGAETDPKSEYESAAYWKEGMTEASDLMTAADKQNRDGTGPQHRHKRAISEWYEDSGEDEGPPANAPGQGWGD